uniref:MTOR-associated protein MEAK7-like n=1 Tax=Styela clava TaxID=7725 RepID=UPI0019393F72|nr:MTOR-associated protein MEAK7-like [Styela clava]
MGLGQSSDKNKNTPPMASHFSTVELKKLEDFFMFKEQVSSDQENTPRKWKYANVKQRILDSFCEEVANQIIYYMENRSMSGGDDGILLESFLEFVYHLTKDCIRELAGIVFNIVGKGDKIVKREVMKKFLTQFVSCLHLGTTVKTQLYAPDDSCGGKLAEKLVKHCPENMTEEDFDVVLHQTPLLIDVLEFKFRMLFFCYISEPSKSFHGSVPHLIPIMEIPDKSTTQCSFNLSLPTAIYINSRLHMQLQHKWRLLYSSKLHGESFSKLTGAIVNKGPTLIVIKDTHGHIFGGFASESWQFSSKFQGTDKSFLFTSHPSLEIYDCIGGSYNDHYMYLNIGQEMMPNGLGMGGQHDYFGLWLDQEFGNGHSRAKPQCTTFKSPQLSKDENFVIDAINIWGVGDEPKNDEDDEYNEEGITSVLDKHIEAKALLEIAGRPRVSEGLRDIEPDADIPETKELQHAHDPMS